MEGGKRKEIRNDCKKGLSYTEIGKKHNIDRRAAKKYGEREKQPEYEL